MSAAYRLFQSDSKMSQIVSLVPQCWY